MKYQISKYMLQRGIKRNIQLQVVKYLDYMEQRENEKPDKGLAILQQVNQKIRESVYKDFYGRVLREQKLFRVNFSSEFLDRLSLHMHEHLYGPGEVIYNIDDIDDKLYFIIKGEIEAFIELKSGEGVRVNAFTVIRREKK